jgi:hypothetical protein
MSDMSGSFRQRESASSRGAEHNRLLIPDGGFVPFSPAVVHCNAGSLAGPGDIRTQLQIGMHGAQGAAQGQILSDPGISDHSSTSGLITEALHAPDKKPILFHFNHPHFPDTGSVYL